MNNDEKSYSIGVSELSEKLGYGTTKTFWSRVNSIPNLVTKLEQYGLRKGQKIFTKKQMELICEHIGFPE